MLGFVIIEIHLAFNRYCLWSKYFLAHDITDHSVAVCRRQNNHRTFDNCNNHMHCNNERK